MVRDTGNATVQGFVAKHVTEDTPIYTDEAKAYIGLSDHDTVKHSAGEYGREMIHTRSRKFGSIRTP